MGSRQRPNSGEAGEVRVGALRRHFMGWQCRLRQHSVRQDGGRPGEGMRPEIVLGDGGPSPGRVTVLIIPRDCGPAITELRHLCKRTFDPADRYESALHYFSAAFYQHPGEFGDEMTALFGHGSRMAARLVTEQACRLMFAQFNQRFELQCRVRAMDEFEPARQVTYWHNSLFNPALPGTVSVLGFTPDWVTARADPPPA